MSVFIATFAVFLLAVGGLAAGVLAGRKPISGSCGGLSAIPGIESECACAQPCARRRAREAAPAESGEGDPAP